MPPHRSTDFLQQFILAHQSQEEVIFPGYLSLTTLRQLITTEIRKIHLAPASYKRFIEQFKKYLTVIDGRVFIKLNPTFEVSVSSKFRKGRPRKVTGEQIRLAMELSELNLPIKNIATTLQIHRSTIWRKLHSKKKRGSL
jgi:hypothetical protein